MLRRIVPILIVLCACSVASADNFRFSYGNRGQAISGYGQPNIFGGYNAYGYDTFGNTYRFNYQPSFVPPLYYPAYNYYRAPVLNDYYRMNPGRGYGMGW
jgi:hypothetical protein